MRLTPRSLAGRLTLLLLLALAIAQGIAVFLFAEERMEAVRHAHRDNVMVRAGTVARLLADTPDALHGPIVSAASTDFVRFSLTEEPLVGDVGTGNRAAWPLPAISRSSSVSDASGSGWRRRGAGTATITIGTTIGGPTAATTMTTTTIITARSAGGATGSPRRWTWVTGAG